MGMRASGSGLADRYGAPRPNRRRALVAASSSVAAVFLAWLGWAAWSHATPEVTSQLVGFDVVDEHRAVARLSVNLAGQQVEASCRLRAIAEDHTVVGERVVTVSGARIEESATLTVDLRTERRATSVESIGCTTDEQPRPR